MSVALTAWSADVTHALLATDRLRVGLLTWGATVQSLQVREGDAWVELVLGFDELAPYLGDHPFLGATVGRYANRIAGARFELDGIEHRLPANDGDNTLHGGPVGFGRRNWRLAAYDDSSVTLTLVSDDGDMGFPGRLEVSTVFRVDGGSVTQETTATSDATTVVNVTNHAYFNLSGSTRPVDDHVVRVPAGCYLPVDPSGIPLEGPPTCVAGTDFDLRRPLRLGTSRFDHTLVLDGAATDPIEVSADGRTLRITTSEPGVQLYSGDHLDGSLRDRHGVVIATRSGLCLETQHFPDSPNRPDYPSTVLRPGATYRTWTRWEPSPRV